jgi:hypothetical protein
MRSQMMYRLMMVRMDAGGGWSKGISGWCRQKLSWLVGGRRQFQRNDDTITRVVPL